MNAADEVRRVLGQPDRYNEYRGYPCPTCGERRTHCSLHVRLARCWECDQWLSLEELAFSLRRGNGSAPIQTAARRNGTVAKPQRRVYQVPS